MVAWLLIQVADTVLPALQMPNWTVSFVTILFILGSPIAVILAWAYEVTPDGIRPDNFNQLSGTSAPMPSSDRKLIYATFGLVLLVAGFQIADRFLLDSNSVENSTGASSNQDIDSGSIRGNLLLGETRVDIVTPTSDAPTDFALSPDGRQIVFAASGNSGTSQLWLRSLATTTAQPLAGTEGARNPFWSPDGRAIGFFDGSALKRIDPDGGAPQTLAPIIGAVLGGTWGGRQHPAVCTNKCKSPNAHARYRRRSDCGDDAGIRTVRQLVSFFPAR